MIFGAKSKEEIAKKEKELTQKYEKKKAEICKKYGIKPKQYDMIAEITSNEAFRAMIPSQAAAVDFNGNEGIVELC